MLGHCAWFEVPFQSLFFIGLARHQLYYPSRAQFPAALAAGSLRGLMAAKRRTPIRDKDLKGLKYFKVLGSLLDRLHDNATAREFRLREMYLRLPDWMRTTKLAQD